MSKKILHLQIPLLEAKAPVRDTFAISPETMGKFVTLMRDKIGEEYEIIISPCNPSVSDDCETFYNFKMEQITKEELLDLIK